MAIFALGTGGLTAARQSFSSVGMTTIGFTVVAGFFASFLLVVVLNEGASIWSFLRTPALQFLGTVSYGIYLLHQPVRGLCFALFLGDAGSPASNRPSSGS